MRVGVIHTAGSPCRCAESVSVGLRALNHEFRLVDSGEIEILAANVAQDCDLIIDHTDTFYGRGLYRPMVRLLLENCGARLVGASAQSCFMADNKASAKTRLAKAGIPVPPGILVRGNSWNLPPWLRPPLVLKPAFEHMSRGITLAHNEQDARTEASRILTLLHQPVLIEAYIPGRELAVSVLDGLKGLEVLPIFEWGIPAAGSNILDEEFKLLESHDEKRRILKADLPDDLKRELEDLALCAFHTLDLRDYARFDVRLSPGASLFFLEANTTPSLEPMEALAVSAQWAGLDYPSLVDRLLSTAQNRHESSMPGQHNRIQVQIPSGSLDLEIPEGVHLPPQSTIELAGLVDIRHGEKGLDLGCGSGLLAIAMAKKGAACVTATDLFPQALETAEKNVRLNTLEDRIEIRAGAWFDALNSKDLFDVIVATPPQTPGPRPFGPKHGGPDGTSHIFKVIDAVPEFLNPEGGRLWLMTVSLANPRRVWERLQEQFLEVILVQETERPFTAAEYEAIQKGLFEYLLSLRSSGISEFAEIESGRYSFRNRIIRAAKPRKK